MTDTRRTPTDPVEIGRGPGPRRLAAACAGLAAAAVALGVAELGAAVVSPASSPVVAVGDAVITLVPEPVKELAIAAFGQHDKTALIVGTLILTALYAMGVGLVSLRSPGLGSGGILAFGLVGLAAAVTRPASGPLDGLPLPRRRRRRRRHPAGAGRPPSSTVVDVVPRRAGVTSFGQSPVPRRSGGCPGRRRPWPAAVAFCCIRRFDVADGPRPGRCPRPPPGGTAARRAASPAVHGLSPSVHPPTRDFYRIDTALPSRAHPEDWRLLHGLVDRELELAFTTDGRAVVERESP